MLSSVSLGTIDVCINTLSGPKWQLWDWHGPLPAEWMKKAVIGLKKKKKKTLSLRIMCVFGPILTAVSSGGVSLKTWALSPPSIIDQTQDGTLGLQIALSCYEMSNLRMLSVQEQCTSIGVKWGSFCGQIKTITKKSILLSVHVQQRNVSVQTACLPNRSAITQQRRPAMFFSTGFSPPEALRRVETRQLCLMWRIRIKIKTRRRDIWASTNDCRPELTLRKANC